MSLGISGYLRRRGARIGKRLLGFLPANLGVRLGISDYLLRCCTRVRTNRVRFTSSTGDVFLSRSLSQSEHLEGSVLGGGLGTTVPLIEGLIRRRRPSE
jgi:hypothetical protein